MECIVLLRILYNICQLYSYILVLFDLFCEFGPRWLTQTPTGLDPSGVGLPRGTSAYGWFVSPPPYLGDLEEGGLFTLTMFCGTLSFHKTLFDLGG